MADEHVGFLDVPGEKILHTFCVLKDNFRTVVLDEENARKIQQYRIKLVNYYTVDCPTWKKYVIQVSSDGDENFKGEFYPNALDATTIDFDRDYRCGSGIIYSAKKSYPNGDAEQLATQWFFNFITDKELFFDTIIMNILPRTENREICCCSVQTLHITIPDQPYENGLLEWWLQKFDRNMKLLIITSNTQIVRIPDNPDLFHATSLELKGLFQFPKALFPRLLASNITFEDLSETSIIDTKVVFSFLNILLDDSQTKRNIKFKGNYEEADIEQSVVDYMEGKATLRRFEDFTREFENTSRKVRATIIFFKQGRDLHLKNEPIQSGE